MFVSKKCNICKKTRIKPKGKAETPDEIATLSAETTIKVSAKQKNRDSHSKIAYVNLIEMESTYHRTCYRNLTREYLSNSANSSKS